MGSIDQKVTQNHYLKNRKQDCKLKKLEMLQILMFSKLESYYFFQNAKRIWKVLFNVFFHLNTSLED